MQKFKTVLPIGLICLYAYLGIYSEEEKQPTAQKELVSSDNKSNTTYSGAARFGEYHRRIRSNPKTGKMEYPANYKKIELDKALAWKKQLKSASVKLDWKERGPHNVGGRTWRLVIDPEDPTGNTWFTASAGGGIWKTIDAGENWENLTPDLALLSFRALAMAPSNHNIMYAGTGDDFSGIQGGGLYKSTNRGTSWTQLTNTNYLKYTKSIYIDPVNSDHLYVNADGALWETIDGGNSLNFIGRYNTLFVHPNNFNLLFAIKNTWMERSSDGGKTWSQIPLNAGGGTAFAFASQNDKLCYAMTKDERLFISNDSGQNWKKTEVTRTIGDLYACWGNSVGFPKTLVVDPTDSLNLFYGGLDVFNAKLTGELNKFDATHMITYENTNPFLYSIQFELKTNDSTLLNSFEIRYGPERKQKAHRFSSTENYRDDLPNSSIYYCDLVEFPFEIWDIKNNVQLSMSFMDNNKNGKYDNNLFEEFLVINGVEYDESGSEIIKDNIGHTYKQIARIRLNLKQNLETYEELPDSKVAVNLYAHKITSLTRIRLSHWDKEITDPQYAHADNLQVQIDQKNGNPFRLITANDGGVAYSDDEGKTWKSPIKGYVTTQFYGVDKHPTQDKYIGGSQDNGCWFSNSNPDEGSIWKHATGGDGFSVIWHPFEEQKMISSTQGVDIYISRNGGTNWESKYLKETQIEENDELLWINDDVFMTNIGYSESAPDQIVIPNSNVLYYSSDFGQHWNHINMDYSFISNRIPIELSKANPDIIWTGIYFSPSEHDLHLSTDKCKNFVKIEKNGQNDFYITDIESHPYLPETAFLLSSSSWGPKILRTDDSGKNWKDLTQKEGRQSSKNGFPDVGVYCLLVMPYDTAEIWVGTDIGLVISTDNGDTWHLADNGLPNVAIWEMKIKGNQVVVATHGRGIWSVELEKLNEVLRNPVLHNVGLNPSGKTSIHYSYMSDYDSIQFLLNHQVISTYHSTQKTISDTIFIDTNHLISGKQKLQLKAYKNNLFCYSGSIEYEHIASKSLKPTTYYFNNFSDDIITDFSTKNFSFRSYEGFPGRAAHSVHPYPEYEECILKLNVPIIIKRDPATGKSTLKFSEIVMIDGYSETEIYDSHYAVVEGTKDGINWIPISDKYGYYNFYHELESFKLGVRGPWYEPDYRLKNKREFNLLETFQENDTIFIRFRLSPEHNYTNGNDEWGWMIDGLVIQSNTFTTNTELIEEEKISINIFPNPTIDHLNIEGLPENTESEVYIHNSSGNRVQTLNLSGTNSRIDMTEHPPGLYIISIKGRKQSYKIVKK